MYVDDVIVVNLGKATPVHDWTMITNFITKLGCYVNTDKSHPTDERVIKH